MGFKPAGCFRPAGQRGHQNDLRIHDAGGGAAEQPCPSLFNTLVLHANGASMICCHANRKGWEGPSLLEHSLEEIWNSPQYLRTREYALGKTRNRDAVFPQCRSCCWL